MRWDDHGGGYGAGGWILMSIAMLLFVTVLVVGAVLLLRAAQHAPAPPHRVPPHYAAPTDSARRILDERFAKGEINEDEYRQRRAVLTGQ